MAQILSNDTTQFVVFKLGKEEYGIEIHKVTTIERLLTITRVPKTAAFVSGVMSLRGEIVPVIDLRKRFGLPQVEHTENTRIIIFKVDEIVIGMIVDEVSEVVLVKNKDIESVNNISNSKLSNYISGIGKISNRIITLLDLENLIEGS